MNDYCKQAVAGAYLAAAQAVIEVETTDKYIETESYKKFIRDEIPVWIHTADVIKSLIPASAQAALDAYVKERVAAAEEAARGVCCNQLELRQDDLRHIALEDAGGKGIEAASRANELAENVKAIRALNVTGALQRALDEARLLTVRRIKELAGNAWDDSMDVILDGEIAELEAKLK